MVNLYLPVREVHEQTRLAKSLMPGEVWRCGKCNPSAHNPRLMAGHIVDHGFDDPETVDWLLTYHPLSTLCDRREEMQYDGQRPDLPESEFY